MKNSQGELIFLLRRKKKERNSKADPTNVRKVMLIFDRI